LTFNRRRFTLLLIFNRRHAISDPRTEVLQGTLDLMVLKTLDSMGPQHGYGIARRIEQLSNDLLRMNQGTLYPALLRLEQRGWISSKWGLSENNRRAKFYSITRVGQKQLTAETENWERVAGIMTRLLRSPQGA
jgi:transcriptional regulator